jgi:para-aminobenzoate synthetase
VLTLLIDNDDSFTGNLFHLLARVCGQEPLVIRNDDPDFDLGQLSRVDGVVLSPGPGTPRRPSDVGWCADVVRSAVLGQSPVPLLGVCLGHQTIAQVLGGEVDLAPEPWHGREAAVRHDGTGLFAGLPMPLRAVRYHSLAVRGLPPELVPTAWTDDGVVMALQHRSRPCWGVQFHPESVRSEAGEALIANFVGLSGRGQAARPAARPADRSRRPDSAADRRPRPDSAADRRPRPGGHPRRLRVLAETMPTPCPSEVLFDELWRSGTHAFWLDSNAPVHGQGRFSIMGDAGGPLARVLTADAANGTVQVTESGSGPGVPATQAQASGCLNWLAADLADRELSCPDLPFDFALGWVGYLGYEVKAECGQPGGRTRPANRPGAGERPPTTPDAYLIFADRALVVDHQTGTTYLLALEDAGAGAGHEGTGDDGTDAAPPPGVARAWLARTRRRLAELTGRRSAPNTWRAPGRQLILRHSREQYLHRIEHCLRQIRQGESYEVCLTNQLRSPPLPDTWAAYRALRRISPAPFGAFLGFGQVQVLSTSPERFLRVGADGQMESRPIKGTRPRGADPEQDRRLRDDLATHEKDRAENMMVVDLVRNDLGRCAVTGSVQVPVLFEVETYPAVHQLVSVVRARLRPGCGAVDVVRAAFPGGSMTGAPKVRTMQIIDRLEDGPRGIYSGAIGYFSLTGAADFSIAIRTMVQTPDALTYGVGGAVVALSDPVAEFEETAVKAEPLLRLLGATFPGREADGSGSGVTDPAPADRG